MGNPPQPAAPQTFASTLGRGASRRSTKAWQSFQVHLPHFDINRESGQPLLPFLLEQGWVPNRKRAACTTYRQAAPKEAQGPGSGESPKRLALLARRRTLASFCNDSPDAALLRRGRTPWQEGTDAGETPALFPRRSFSASALDEGRRTPFLGVKRKRRQVATRWRCY